MSKMGRRSFSREFKLKVIERLEAGESGTVLALGCCGEREVGVGLTNGSLDLGPLPVVGTSASGILWTPLLRRRHCNVPG